MMMHCRVSFFILLACAIAWSSCGIVSDAAARNSYFNMSEVESDNLSPFPKWTGNAVRYKKQGEQFKNKECGKDRFNPCSVHEWENMLSTLQDKSLREQLDKVNDWSNAHPYIEDMVNWGMVDYWETPFEFMEISGDCEDYAISKYYSLRALGVAAAKMRIIIVQDLNLGGIIHAILGVYDQGRLLILDNQADQVIPAMKIYHYRPIYGINEQAWWAYTPDSM